VIKFGDCDDTARLQTVLRVARAIGKQGACRTLVMVKPGLYLRGKQEQRFFTR